jgi:hypothetical protein
MPSLRFIVNNNTIRQALDVAAHNNSDGSSSSSSNRRLEDYLYTYNDYASSKQQQQQHPWFTVAMLVLLGALLLIVAAYGLYMTAVGLKAKDFCFKQTAAATTDAVELPAVVRRDEYVTMSDAPTTPTSKSYTNGVVA